MPAQEITDLSDLLSEPKHVVFESGGEVFTLPGDIPLELYLQINREAQNELTISTVEGLRDRCLQLLKIHQPELIELPCSLTQLIMMIPRVYGSGSPPTTPARPRAKKPADRKTVRKPAPKRPAARTPSTTRTRTSAKPAKRSG